MLRLETPSSGVTADATRWCVDPECLACCAASGKQRPNNPSARTSAPLNMREFKTKSAQTPVKSWAPLNSSIATRESLEPARPRTELSESRPSLFFRFNNPDLQPFNDSLK